MQQLKGKHAATARMRKLKTNVFAEKAGTADMVIVLVEVQGRQLIGEEAEWSGTGVAKAPMPKASVSDPG